MLLTGPDKDNKVLYFTCNIFCWYNYKKKQTKKMSYFKKDNLRFKSLPIIT